MNALKGSMSLRAFTVLTNSLYCVHFISLNLRVFFDQLLLSSYNTSWIYYFLVKLEHASLLLKV